MKHTVEILVNNGPFDTMTEYTFSDGSRYIEIIKPTDNGGYRSKVLHSQFAGDNEVRTTRHDLTDACKASTRVDSLTEAPASTDLPAVGANLVHKDGTVFVFVGPSKDGKTYRVENVLTGKRGYVRISAFTN